MSQDAIEAARERVRLAEEDYRRLQRIAADAAQVVAEVKGRLGGAWEVGIEPKEGESLSQQVQRIGAELAEAEKRAEEAEAAAKGRIRWISKSTIWRSSLSAPKRSSLRPRRLDWKRKRGWLPQRQGWRRGKPMFL